MADRLPRITLDGCLFYGTGSDFTGPAGILLGSIVQPLLEWGARKAEVESSRPLYVERLAVFSQAYLQAIEDSASSSDSSERCWVFVFSSTVRWVGR